MSILRTIAFFAYMFGYPLLHLPTMFRGRRALEAGDMETVKQITDTHVPHWAGTLLKLAGARVTVVGKENIPSDRACVFVANHRSYTDILIMLTCLDEPHGLLSKQQVDSLPLVRTWMRLLGCVFVNREDVRAAMRALNEATERVAAGSSFTIFPEGTRWKGTEGTMGEFKGGAFRIAAKCGAPLVPVVISGTRSLMENNKGHLFHPADVTVHILPPVETAGLSRTQQKALPEALQQQTQAELAAMVS